MAAETSFDYYYGDESNQFSFYRIPRQLVTGDRFKRLSTDAKLLYGLLLDRMSLSAKNGWYDEQGRVYIYYTLDEIQEDLNCGHDKATRMLVELDNGKNGFGLIERVRQGQGRPTKIYVKRFTTRAVPTPPPELSPRPRLFSGQDCGEVAAKTAEKPQSRVRGSRSQDCGKVAPNYIKTNQTDFSYTDPSILPSGSPPGMAGMGRMDRLEQRREVDEAIGYESLCSQFNREDVDEIAELIVDVLCTTRPTLRIGGEELPIAQVKDRFYKLDSGHLEYVFDCLRNNTTQIRNIRAYLLTALYNAPSPAVRRPFRRGPAVRSSQPILPPPRPAADAGPEIPAKRRHPRQAPQTERLACPILQVSLSAGGCPEAPSEKTDGVRLTGGDHQV